MNIILILYCGYVADNSHIFAVFILESKMEAVTP